MLRPAFLLLLFVPLLSLAQKADKRVVKALQADIAYLASEDLQGRTTGSDGERKAADYLIARYEKLKIPAFGGSYRHPFTFVRGIEMNDTRIVLGGQSNLLGGDAFPLPFSANAAVAGDVLVEVQELGAIWLLPLFASMDEAADAKFNWQESAYRQAIQAAKDGATGVVFYDNYGATTALKFDPLCALPRVKIPVAYVGHKQWKELSGNGANMVSVTLDIRLSKPDRKADNVVAWIDNKASKTLVIGANYDQLGTFEAAGAGGTIHAANDNASGTAAVLQLAEWLKKNRLRNYNIILAHFSGGRIGQLGATAFCKESGFEASQIAGMMDLYTIGQLTDSAIKLQLSPGAGFPARTAMSSTLRKAGIGEAPFGARPGGSEYEAFERNGISALAISGESRVTEAGRPEHINYNAEARIIAAIQVFLRQMDATAGKQ